jgi:putative ABC transport system permease protein
MLSLVLRGFMQRKLRAFLTGVAIALGVALMAGTYVLTDTINHSFASIFQEANHGNDVVISPTESLGREVRSQVSPVTQPMLAKVRGTPGVAEAAGTIFSPGTFLDVSKKRLTTGGAPAFVASEGPKRFQSFHPVQGRSAANASEVAIDQATADRSRLKIGQQMIVAGRTQAKRYTIVGIVKFGAGQSFGGAGAAILVPAEAQRVVGEPGHFDEIDVAAAPGVTPSQLRDRIRALLPGTVSVRTGAEQAKKESSDLESNLGFLRTFLLVFAYVSLVVGAFIIFNTFSITVAQRTREFGLLRTLGGSRSQIMRSVVAEGLLLGVTGAVLGLLGGLVLAPALDQLFKAFGADLPDSGTVLETRTIVVSLAVGIVVTVLAGLPPALRATRVPPIAALREGVEISPRTRFRLRKKGSRHRLTRALAHAVGTLVTWRGITGRLARENTIRQPGRTLITAAALTVGLALVTFVAVLADGTKATIDRAVSRSFAGNLIVENSQAGSEQGIPAPIGPALRKVEGVGSVTPIAFTLGRPTGSKSNATITAIEPQTFAKAYKVEWKQGSNATLATLEAGGAIATKGYANSEKLKIGQRLLVLTPASKRVSLVVQGIASDNARLLGNLTISLALARSAFGQREDALDFVSYVPGATDAQVQPKVDKLLAGSFPQARSRTAEQFKKDQADQINTLLALIYVLLALSVVVSLFGIVNTLVLSIYERTRELGMMRAIGTSRRQVRQMIRYESVITALIGGVFGLVIGIVAAILVTSLLLSGSGYVQAVPIGTLIVLLVVAATAGVLAAWLPARRAAKIDLLEALASE